jgi:hypothetical protein
LCTVFWSRWCSSVIDAVKKPHSAGATQEAEGGTFGQFGLLSVFVGAQQPFHVSSRLRGLIVKDLVLYLALHLGQVSRMGIRYAIFPEG